MELNGDLLSQLKLELMGEIRREIAKAKQEIIDGKKNNFSLLLIF